MNEKNMAIFSQMLENAKEVFDSCTIDVGTYSIKELVKLEERRRLFYDFQGKEFRVKVGEHSKNYFMEKAFRVLNDFCKREKIKCPLFNKFESGEPVGTFTMEVPADAKILADFVAHEGCLHPVLENIFINVAESFLCASDGYKIRIVPIVISDLTGEYPDYTYIKPAIIKYLSGRCNVRVYINGNYCTTEITDERGQVYISRQDNVKYPNVRGAIPNLSYDYGYIKFTQDDAKRFAKWLDSSTYNTVKLEVLTNSVRVSHFDADNEIFDEVEEFSLERKGENCTMIIAFTCASLKKVCNSGWDGGIWFTGTKRASIFDSAKGELTVLISRNPNYMAGIDVEVKESNIDAFDRLNFTSNANLPQREEPKSVPETIEREKEIEKIDVSWATQTKHILRNYRRKYKISL